MTVCFTGHRDLGGSEERSRLIARLEEEVHRLALAGATVFRAGGALGFDTEAAMAVLREKRRTVGLRLELLLPCRDQCAHWQEEQIRLYRAILDRADAHTYLSEHYYQGVMHVRNRALVDGADICVAFLREGAHGGTSYTVDYARRKGVPVINLSEKA